MKITRVECLILANEHPIVRVETDEGIVGWGECFRRARGRWRGPPSSSCMRPR